MQGLGFKPRPPQKKKMNETQIANYSLRLYM